VTRYVSAHTGSSTSEKKPKTVKVNPCHAADLAQDELRSRHLRHQHRARGANRTVRPRTDIPWRFHGNDGKVGTQESGCLRMLLRMDLRQIPVLSGSSITLSITNLRPGHRRPSSGEILAFESQSLVSLMRHLRQLVSDSAHIRARSGGRHEAVARLQVALIRLRLIRRPDEIHVGCWLQGADCKRLSQEQYAAVQPAGSKSILLHDY